MSQLTDITAVVSAVPKLSDEVAGQLLLDIFAALNWDVDGVQTVDDAIIFMSLHG